jgi:stearoyl-CoA desaturase (Delta-9 desaturase)
VTDSSPRSDAATATTVGMNAHDPVAAAASRPWHRIYLHPGTIPFWGVHVAAIVGIAWLGWSWTGLLLAIALYVPRLFFVTAGYHRYFSHRTFKTSRWFQLVLAIGATTTAQKGVLWWAAHHRRHHKLSDQPGDVHAPRYGFWWSHVGWIVSPAFQRTDLARVKDLARYPELRFLNRFWILPVVAVAVALFAIGGPWALVWGFFVSQVMTWHGTFTINSLTHVIGKRRYATPDDSKNHWGLALLTLGEGWHNNHHHYQSAARQGFRWWEIDVTWYILRGLAVVGLVRDLRGVPDHVRDARPAWHSEAACGSLPPASSSGAPS